jgi:hypothetical protein
MDREYEQIRKGLMALMCVGDRIRWLRSNSLLTEYYITTHRVTEIHDNNIVFDEWDYRYVVPKVRLECWEGQLYIWDNSDAFYPYRGKKRIREMSYILKTLYQYERREGEDPGSLISHDVCR